MAIRKEQVLALIVIAIGVWSWSRGAEDGGARAMQGKVLEWKSEPVVAAPLAGAGAGGFARRELFTEPRETHSLPPRDLDFPPRAALSVVALPLEPGPDLAHAMLLAGDGEPVADVTLQNGAEPAASESPPSTDGAQPGGQNPGTIDKTVLDQTYDQLFVEGLSAPYYGFVEVVGMNIFDAEKLTDFSDRVVNFREFSTTTGKIGRTRTFKADTVGQKVRQIKLADNLRNEVARRLRSVPADALHAEERGELITWLLGKAKDATWIYDDALRQAEAYSQLSQGDLEGLRWQLRVLQAKGDLEGEFALLEGISGEHRESAFRYEGLGIVKAKLGLFESAEQDLRHAAELGRNDARPNAALAAFLCQRGRGREAVAAAQQAQRAMGTLTDSSDRVRAVRAIVASHLAVGDCEAARAALSLLPPERPQPYLTGCVAYAAGDLDGALAAFRQAAVGDHSASGLLGQGAVLLRQQHWQEAYDAFVAVADQAPLLRHRAWSGLGLLYQRIGQLDSSLSWLDRALEADPQDAYSHYLRGRTLRLQRQFAAAEDALNAALRLRDDFVHAIAEMAALQSARADEARGEDQAAATLRAMRYGDRAAKLAFRPSVELYELEALYQFAAGSREAAATFAKARDVATDETAKRYARGAIAVVDYSRGQTDDATAVLLRFSELPKDDAMRVWAERILAEIQAHANKELLEDRFERNVLGGSWESERDGGTLVPDVRDNRLMFRGSFSGKSEVWAERSHAVQHAKDFLAVGCTMQLGAGQPRDDGYAGLRIETQRTSKGTPDTQIAIGIREGKPHLRIVDNREEPKDEDLEIPGFDFGAEQQLELRVLPREDRQSRVFTLQMRWNDVVVREIELKGLSGSSSNELRTILFVSGTRGRKADVAFDDYRLERERRKDG